MSEYQFVHFLAVDKPLSAEQLKYMRRQSTRAEITRREFTNEYHFGDFRGNVIEMLRRGFDLHLHYANFGVRTLVMRLPNGLPCDKKTWQAFACDAVDWKPDKKGRGGILIVEPYGEPDAFAEIYDDLDALLPALAPLRSDLMDGDLRMLYLVWLAFGEPEELEPPVPAGLGQLSDAHRALLQFFDISDDLIAAAATASPKITTQKDSPENQLDAWVAAQPAAALRKLLRRAIDGEGDELRAEILHAIRGESGRSNWQFAEPTRTWEQLRKAEAEFAEARRSRERKKREAARVKRLKQLADHPDRAVAQVHELVKKRSLDSYQKAASQLADLREALGPEAGPKFVSAAAQKLRSDHPKWNQLISALRKEKLL